MKTECLIWKLIKRLVRAERERDDWEARFRQATANELTKNVPSSESISIGEQEALERIGSSLLDLSEVLKAVDAQHPLSPHLAKEYVTRLGTHRDILRAIVDRVRPDND